MKIKVYNLEGKTSSEMEISDDIFAVKIKPEVVHEVFVALSSNQRQPWAHAKNKGEVRGGGRKPWAQKGTGRARHGSIRSPLWKGGGVTFGPLSTRNFKKKINKKVRQLALKMCLTDRSVNKALWIVEDFNFSEPKTKIFNKFLQDLPVEQKTFLVLTNGKNEKVIQMTNNIKSVKVMRVEDTNVLEILNKQAIITSKKSLQKLEEILKK
ncbi:MAG: 50S ribosomal protein L4 [Parcubacteria group bacterium]|nr:50S ribosomal protein L4 [Parcubacteria group bacterium]